MKVKTIAKRFSDIKKRYNINIQTTTAGYTTPRAAAGMKIEKKGRGRPPKRNSVSGTGVRDAAIKTLLEDDEISSRCRAVAKGRLPATFDASAQDEDVAPSQ